MKRKFNGDKLTLLRESVGLSQVDLAKKLNVRSSAQVSRWESGDQQPKPRKLKSIATFFSVKIPDLLMDSK